MATYANYDVAEMLGLTRVARISDKEVFEHLLTPTVKAMLGPIADTGKPKVIETEQGQLPGFNASNLNSHLLYGGQTGFVRFPYIETLYRTLFGAIVVRRDGRKLKVMALHGDWKQGKAELIHMAALRDRRYDGTKAGNDTALLDFPYDHPVYSRPLHPEARSLELSIYSFLPGSRISDVTGDFEFEAFVESPYRFLDDPDLFLKLFRRAFLAKRSPGQSASPIPDVSKLAMPGFERLARKAGYDFVEGAASHYHVAMWLMSAGYRLSYAEDVQTMSGFAAGLKAIRDAGMPLSRPQQSWICVLQSLRPSELIPDQLRLSNLKWPQDNIGPENLWLHKPLTARASQLVPGPLPDKHK